MTDRFASVHDDAAMATLALRQARLAHLRDDRAAAVRHLASIVQFSAPSQLAQARLLEAEMVHEEDPDAAVASLRDADKIAVALKDPELLLEVADLWRVALHRLCAQRASKQALDALCPGAGQAEPAARPAAPCDARQRFLMAVAYMQLAAVEEQDARRFAFWAAARNLRDPILSPVAALELGVTTANAHKRLVEADGYLRDALSYEHPEASPEAAFELAGLQLQMGLPPSGETLELLEGVRDDSGHPKWSERAAAAIDRLPEWRPRRIEMTRPTANAIVGSWTAPPRDPGRSG